MADSAASGGGFYAGLEEKYYSFLDALEEKGIPVYKIVDPIEGANIPTFPLAIVLLLAIIGLLAFGANSALFGEVDLNVVVKDGGGKGIEGATVKVLFEDKSQGEKLTDNEGKATLKVPTGKEVTLKVAKRGYDEAAVKYTVKGTGETATVTMQDERVMVKKTINLLAAGTSRAFAEDIEVEFSCTGADFSTKLRSSAGQIEVEVPSDCDTLRARPVGDYTVSRDTIFLSSDTTYELALSAKEGAVGIAVVAVKGAGGEAAAGIDVSLVTATLDNTPGTTFSTKPTSAAGTATFSDVPAGRYFITTYDRAGNYAEYDGGSEGVVQEVRSGGTTEFTAVLNQSISGKIRLVVKDKETGERIAGALVKLSKGQAEVKTSPTSADGSVEFSVAEEVEYSILVDKPTYLLLNAKARPSQDAKELLLEQATAENSQSLMVSVLDETEKPIENARVRLKGNADGAQAGPELVTGLDGRVVFERVQDGTYYVYAEKPGYGNKSSDPIVVTSRKQNSLKLFMPLGSGRVEAGIVDADGRPVTNATIKAVDFSTSQVLQEAGADSDGKKVFTIRADRKAFLVVSAEGYATVVTVPMAMQRDVTLQKSVVLQKAVASFEVKPVGLFAGEESVSEAGSALTPGQKYTARFTLMVPKGTAFDEAGVHIRVGEEGSNSIEKDYIYIAEARAAYKSLTQGTTYTPKTGQGNDFQHLTTGNSKWANIVFRNVAPGTYEIEVDVQVRPEAKIGAPLQLSYRAWGKSGSGYMRFPNDAELGTAESGASKQGLYANALRRVFSAGPSSLCANDFCSRYSVEDLREKIVSSVVESYTGQIGNRYRLSFEIASASRAPFSQAQLSLKDGTGSIAIESYTVRTAAGQELSGTGVGSQVSLPVGELSQDSVVGGEVTFSAKKEGNVPIEVAITSGSGQGSQSIVYQKTIYIRLLPAAGLGVDVLPKIIVPFINNNILVRVTDDNGLKAVSNAAVSIKKDGAVVSSGETDIDGVFAYTLLSPSDGSVVGVAVEKTGFKPVEKELKVTPNILQAMPESLRLSMTVGGKDFKTLSAAINNFAQIPLEVYEVQFSREFEGYVDFSIDSPEQGDIIAPDSNATLSAIARLGPRGGEIDKPTKLQGTVTLHLVNQNFKQKWVAAIPLEATIGFGDEVDDTTCFTLNPSDWKIFGGTAENKRLEIGFSNSCAVGGEKVRLSNLSARIVSGSENLFGTFRATSSLEGGKAIDLDKAFRVIAASVPQGANEKITIEFKPQQVVSGKAEGRIEVQATHLASSGEQKLLQKVEVKVSVNNLNECVEVLANRDITINSCPGNIGFGNYGSRFSQAQGSRYSQFDPYSSRYGSGQGNPPWLTPSNQVTGSRVQGGQLGFGNRAPLGWNYYDYTYSGLYGPQGNYNYGYQNTFFPNTFFQQPFYTGLNSFNSAFDTAWSCGPANLQVRNNCASPIELSFEAQPGITVANKTSKVEPGNIEDVSIEPTNFFGRYGLDVKAKPSESNEKASTVKRVFVNVTNEFAKDYRDCISISPAGTMSFSDFLGKPAILTVRNDCYGQGVFLRDDPSTITFAVSSVLSPTNEDPNRFGSVPPGTGAGTALGAAGQQGIGTAGQAGVVGQGGTPFGVPTQLPGYQNNPNLYYASNVSPGMFPQALGYSQFGGLIQSVEALGAEYQTSPDGRVSQVLKFNIIKNVHEYRNRAPEPKFFTNNPFYNAGNLRYFVSHGYYTVNARSILFVRFTTPSGIERSVSFPLTLQDFWPLLEYAEQLARKFVSYGDPSVTPANCLNLKALDFSRLEVPADIKLRTLENENGPLFKVSTTNQQGVCGTVDKLELLETGDFRADTGLVMKVRPDPVDPDHELEITFDTSKWDGRPTEFRNRNLLGKVTKASPPTANNVSLSPINARVKAGRPGQPEKQQPGQPGGGTLTGTECMISTVEGENVVHKPAGETGTGIYRNYGFQHFQYKWGAAPENKITFVERSACDAYLGDGRTLRDLNGTSPPMFCDALQASISLSQKTAEVRKVVDVVKIVDGNKGLNGRGTCSEGAGFNCGDADNMHSANLFRYALSQSKAGGYFLGDDGAIVNIGRDIDLAGKVSEATRTLVTGIKGAQITFDNVKDNIIPNTGLVISNLGSVDRDSIPAGASIVLELRGWDANELVKTKDRDWVYPSDIGAETPGTGWYVLPLGRYGEMHRALQQCMQQNPKFTECRYSYNGSDRNITGKFIEQLGRGTWKLTARNTSDMGQEVKDAVMKRAKWETATEDMKRAYAGFFQFSRQNISPVMYLMADSYSDEFVGKLLDSEFYKELFKGARPKFGFVNSKAGDLTAEARPGRYTGTVKYNWGREELEITFSDLNDLITGMGLKGYAANPLFEMPIDGTLNWGTKFSNANASLLYFDFEESQTGIGGQGKTTSDSPRPAIGFVYEPSYSVTRTGRVASIGRSEFRYAPSEPVQLGITIRKDEAKKPAGMLFDFIVGGARTEMATWFTVVSDTISGRAGTTTPLGSYNGSQVCSSGEVLLSRPEKYQGFRFEPEAAAGTSEFSGLVFVPSRITSASGIVSTSINVACVKASGSIKVGFPMNSGIERQYVGSGQALLSIDETKDNYKKLYNLRKLLDMVKDDSRKICVTSSSGKVDLYWNEAAFRG